MSAQDFDRDLEHWLSAEAPSIAPASLHSAVIERARRMGQRPGWLVNLKGGTLGRVGLMGRSGVRLAYVLVALVLTVAAVAGAILVGALRPDPFKPSARNGTIAYSVVNRDDLHYYHAHLLNADGTADRAIGEGRCPTFSRDGTALTYMRGHEQTAELFIAAPDGSSPRVVPGVGDSQYALSPDRTKIAWFKRLTPKGYSVEFGRAELWVAPLDGGPGVRIVPAGDDPNEYFAFPVWSPDSSLIAFTSNVVDFTRPEDRTYRSAIYVVGADGSALRPITTRPEPFPPDPFGNSPTGISWSPDGSSLAYLGIPDGWSFSSPSPGPFGGPPWPPNVALDVFVVGADGTGDRNLTNSPSREIELEWSPDGSRLAYVSYEGDDGGLFLIRMDGRSPAEQPMRGPIASEFIWAPDGTRLLWHDGQAFWTVDAGFREPPRILFSGEATSIQCTPSWQALGP